MTDDSPALNARIAAGGIVPLEGRDYGIGAPLDGSTPNVTLRGVPGVTRLVKLAQPDGDGILSPNGERSYRGWTFEGIEFDGGRSRHAPAPGVSTLYLTGSHRVRFDRCRFRDLVGAVQVRDSRDVAFDDCDFFGTTPGVFAAGVMDPPAVPGATFGSGINVLTACRDVAVTHCRFHFCETGIGVNVTASQSASDLRVEGCEFRADWWDNPGPVLRFTPTSVEPRPGGRVTHAGGGFAGLGSGHALSFRRDLATGTGFARLYAGEVGAAGTPFAMATRGDVVETQDGRRARVASVESPTTAWVEGWESSDTYEECGPPPPGTPWRLARYYACGIAAVESDTTLALYFEPVSVFTGERAISDAKLDLARLPAKVTARTIYSGIHVNAGLDGLLVSGCRFTGGMADQCSAFNLRSGARILGNAFRYGQDEGVTLDGCPGSVVAGNAFVNSGVSAIFAVRSDPSVLAGNHVRNWGMTNPGRAALDTDARAATLATNSVTPASDPGPQPQVTDHKDLFVGGNLTVMGTITTSAIDLGEGRRWTSQGLFLSPERHWTDDGLFPGIGVKWPDAGGLIGRANGDLDWVDWVDRANSTVVKSGRGRKK